MKRTLRATFRCRATCGPDLMMTDGAWGEGGEYQGALVIAAPTPFSGPGLRCKFLKKQKWNLIRKGFTGQF